jgi:4-amino-4-deoxy-L-arabinose transferase-like glycosyltransferase
VEAAIQKAAKPRYPAAMLHPEETPPAENRPAENPPEENRPEDNGADPETESWSFVLAMAVAAALVLPLLGAVGFFDPWETHYGEVARQMAVRDDYLYPFWKDSYFFSKPILLFWLTAPLYKLIGADEAQGSIPAMAELVGRLPSALSSLLAVAAVYFAARRLWSRRAALFSAIALGTMPFWTFLGRQAITDMLYVAPASAALLLLAVALFGEDPEEGRTSTKESRLPRWLVVAAGICTIPQLWEIGRSGAFLNRVVAAEHEAALRIVVSLLLCLVAGGGLFWLWRRARDPLLHAAALLFALSMLAKGPVGVALCALTLLVTIAIIGEWRRLLRPAALSCTVLFLAVAAPWPIVMAFFRGLDDQRKTWVQRFIFYDLLGRVGPGAHGDRGTFEYYARYAGFGMFPWSGFLPPALFAAASAARAPRSSAQRFTVLVAVWAIVTFVFFAATTTKFHHYILPLCVPAALLVGRWLDRVLEDPSLASPVVALFGVSIAVLIGRDLVTEPWQLADLFTYHYKSYKPEYYFPADPEWRFGLSVACFGAAAIVAAGIALDMLRRRQARATAGSSRSIGAWLWNIVLGRPAERSGFVAATLAASVLFGIFAVQVYFNRASQHWSQRALFETYASMRAPGEPLIAFQMDWKGETFYGKNQEIQIKKSGVDLKKAVERPGREFILVQTDRFGGLKNALGKELEPKIRVVDRSNQKWYLLVVD